MAGPLSRIILLLLLSPGVGWGLARAARAFTGVEASFRWLIIGALAVTVSAIATPSQPLPISLCLGWALLLLAAIDIAVLRLPDLITLPLATLGFGFALWRQDAPLAHLSALCAGFASFAVIDWLYVRFRGRSGLGMGDAKLFGAAGAWLGPYALPAVLLLACAGGLIWVAQRVLRKGLSHTRAPLPFGAPLCAAIWILWAKG